MQLATTIHAAVGLTGTPPPRPSTPASGDPFVLDTAGIARILGATGRLNGGVCQVAGPRAERIRAKELEVPPSLGLGTVINFQPTEGG